MQRTLLKCFLEGVVSVVSYCRFALGRNREHAQMRVIDQSIGTIAFNSN